jgi:hypothetical protein
MIEPRSRGVLDSPLSRGMTVVLGGRSRRLILRHYERSEAIQRCIRGKCLDCFVARTPRNDDVEAVSLIALGFRHHRPAGADIAPLE